MASKKSGSKGGARAGKGKATMSSLKDLELKGSQKIKGGTKSKGNYSNLSIMKVLDKTSP